MMMDYALLLTFDDAGEETLCRLMTTLAQQGAGQGLLDLGLKPHVTLAAFNTGKLAAVDQALAGLSAAWAGRLDLKLASAGFFPGQPATLFLAPAINQQLLALHQACADLLAPLCGALSAHYLADNWVPHCTLALDLTPQQLQAACQALSARFQPLTVRASGLSLIACCPFRGISRHRLGD